MADLQTIPAGSSVQEILQLTCDPILHMHARVWLHGLDVTDIDGFHAQAGDKFVIALRPLGGGGGGKKSALGTVLSIVVAVVAWYAAPVIFGGAGAYGAAGWASIAGTSAGTMASIGAFAINMVGSMLISSLVAPPKISTNGSSAYGSSIEQPQSYFITGQSNQAKPFGPVLRLYGRHKIMPLMAANPIIDNVGTSSAFSQLFDFGFGDIEIDESTLQIGDVPLSEYDPLYYIYRNAIWPALKLVTNRFGFDQYNVLLQPADPFTIRSKPETNQAQVTLSFPSGLGRLNDNGTISSQRAEFYIRWRELGTTEWRSDSISFAGANAGFVTAGSTTDLGTVLEYFSGYCWKHTDITFTASTQTGDSVVASGLTTEISAQIAAVGGVWQENVPFHNEAHTVHFEPRKSGNLTSSNSYGLSVNLNPALAKQGIRVAVTGVTRAGNGDYYCNVTVDNPANTWPAAQDQYSLNLIEYQAVQAGQFYVTGTSLTGFNLVITIDFPSAKQYEIQLQRITPVATDTRTSNRAVLTLLESRLAGDVLKLQRPHTLMEMRINATEKLNGTVQTLSAIGTSVLRTTTDGVNFTTAPTRNPAWICVDILTGVANPKPLNDSQVDWPSWIALAAYCDEIVTRNVNGVPITQKRFTCDTVIDYETTCGELVDSILSSCRASRMVTRGGKYGVLIDQEKTIPRQVITPKNSWNFSGNRSFIDIPHALRVSYIDGDKLAGSGFETWNRAEILVYRDGFNADNSSIFEDLGTYGITDYASAWSFGRYMMAQGVFRNELFNLSMDVENLACARGDLVEVQHDVPMVGGIASYVVTVGGNTITITENLSQVPTGYSVRLSNGNVRSGSVTSSIDTKTFVLDDATGIESGDLIVLGTLGRVTGSYLVQGIAPGPDLTADMTLLRYVPAVYRVDTEPIPEYFPDFGDDFINTTDMQVINLTASAQNTIYADRIPYGVFDLNWQVQGFQPARYELLVTFANGERDFITDVQGLTYQYAVNLVTENDRGGIVSFELTPYTSANIQGTGAIATSEVVIDTSGPGAVPGFGLDVQDMTCVLFWQPNSEPDVEFYVLRYSADVNGSWDASQLIGTFGYATNRTSVGARTGRYFIRAIDTSGNGGVISSRRTTIEFLPNLVPVITLNEAPLWPGSKSDVVQEGGTIVSGGAYGSVNAQGYYFMADVLDLLEVCEVRVSSKILGYGKSANDIMANWIPLASVTRLASVTADQWNLRLEFQASAAVIFIAQWPTLADPIANPIASGVGTWTDWRPIEVGDVTGRFIKFRMRLESFDPNVKAVMTDGRIEIDAPDRTLKAQNLEVPIGGTHVTFSEPFMFRPSLAITIDNAIDVLTYVTSNIDKYGFDLELFDAGTSAAGVVDWAALGNGKIKSDLPADFFRDLIS